MRVAVSIANIQQVLDAGACVNYLALKSMTHVYAEGKPDHLRNLIQLPGMIVCSEIEPVPTTKPASDFIDI